jgi:EAL domain-containing protein (putative c-di-GMP-specific phosphodiesterase class I)
MNEIPASTRNAPPYLQCVVSGEPRRIPLQPLPFRIGRGGDSYLVVNSQQVSKDHAEIVWMDGSYFLLDRESTNGTFVNGARIYQARLQNGDIINFAHEECRFVHSAPDPANDSVDSTPVVRGPLPLGLIRRYLFLQELLQHQSFRAVFQPIVDLSTRRPIGFEALARGTHEQLSPNPADLLHLAEQSGLAGELSRQFRLAAAKAAGVLPAGTRLFFNLHPAELSDAHLLDSLSALQRELAARYRIVLEVHEDSVTDIAGLRRLSASLATLEMEFAYDDFGAGQSRLMELAEVSPRFIKLDMRLTRGIDHSQPRQEIVRALTHAARELGVLVIAEGIEAAAEADACLDLGCSFAQGFLFGRPRPAEALQHNRPDTSLIDVSSLRNLIQLRESKSRNPSHSLT